jgi:hypothetical protein
MLREFDAGMFWNVDELVKDIMATEGLDGITITGGEPMEWLKQALPGNTNAPIDGTGGRAGRGSRTHFQSLENCKATV